MSRSLTNLEKELVRIFQEDLPLVPRPFLQIAEKLNLTEDEVIDYIRRFKEEGIIRRFGVALRHWEAGITANAMIVWQIPIDKVKEVGKKLASFPEVTHCYQRPQQPDWPYNLYTMIHRSNREDCEKLAAKLASAVDQHNYRLIFSTKELKKESMKYFVEGAPECRK
ncbi:MAG: siroheme decarboxylase [Clostridia bacterium]|nr:siroheme decarboxylase [Clostridia bacterium]